MLSEFDTSTFVYNIRLEYSRYLDKLARREKLGRPGITPYKMKAFLLAAYLRILLEYCNNVVLQITADNTIITIDSTEITVNTYVVETGNFFTASEIAEILRHFNTIAECEIYINFED